MHIKFLFTAYKPFIRGFKGAYKINRGALKWKKKKHFESSLSSADQNTFFIYWFLN